GPADAVALSAYRDERIRNEAEPYAGSRKRRDRGTVIRNAPPIGGSLPESRFCAGVFGWGTWIRTRTNGVGVRGSTVNLCPIRRRRFSAAAFRLLAANGK